MSSFSELFAHSHRCPPKRNCHDETESALVSATFTESGESQITPLPSEPSTFYVNLGDQAIVTSSNTAFTWSVPFIVFNVPGLYFISFVGSFNDFVGNAPNLTFYKNYGLSTEEGLGEVGVGAPSAMLPFSRIVEFNGGDTFIAITKNSNMSIPRGAYFTAVRIG